MIKQKIKVVLKQLSQYVSIHQLHNWSQQPLFSPFYHAIGEAKDLPHIRHLYPLRTVAQFEKDLDYFLKYFEPIDLPSLAKGDFLSNTQPQFFLSFDDGLREIYHVIAPILKRKGIPATFFINPHFVDNKELFFRYKASLLIDSCFNNSLSKGQQEALGDSLKIVDINAATLKKAILHINYQQQHQLDDLAEILAIDFEEFLQEKQPYLTIAQLKDLQKDGFHIGAHSLDHPRYAAIDFSEQLRQTVESAQYVRVNFADEFTAFAFPFTDYQVASDFFEVSKREGYFDCSFGTAGLKSTEFDFHFQRFPMEAQTWNAEDLVKTEYLYYLLKRLVGKH